MERHSLELIARASLHGDRIALDVDEDSFTYRKLLDASAGVAAALLDGRAHLEGDRVSFLVPPGFRHVAVQWGIWRAGGVAVPLAVSHPPAELQHVIDDSGANIVVSDTELTERVRPLVGSGARLLDAADAVRHPSGPLPDISESEPAMMLYTSGTTGRPKGAVLTHSNIRAQVTALVEAWEWSADDRILLTLPLHHVHGIVNVLTCALWSGARCDILSTFDAAMAWQHFARGHLTLFMAVPTIYRRLIAEWETRSPADRDALSAACRQMRLMVSGSAALPVQTLERWQTVSSHVLLERYGMTEIGMALANPLRGERRPGHVGMPLPGVQVRLVDEDGDTVSSGTAGEIEVRGASVFKEYWKQPAETRSAFRDGWFRTGDIAILDDGYYRILGRQSVDIIKTGGYKVSALEIEEVLRTHEAIGECAVVGVEDAEWGECVSVAIELRRDHELSLETLRAWARDRLAPYKIPTRCRFVTALPRNAMGKVTKKAVAALFPTDYPTSHSRDSAHAEH